jgi:hypothetical protein
MTDLPATILRPSIIAGDSRTGATTSFKTIYWPLKIYASKRWRTIPGFADTVVDVVPVDFVAQAAAHLALDERAIGRTLHLCAGPRGSATLGQIGAFASEFFALPPPRFVNPTLFFAILRPVLLAAVWGRRRGILRSGRFYEPYFRMRMTFDTNHAAELLEPAGIHPPKVLDYLDCVFRYCVESDWGRRAVSPGLARC